jgi:hypothetical protein
LDLQLAYARRPWASDKSVRCAHGGIRQSRLASDYMVTAKRASI